LSKENEKKQSKLLKTLEKCYKKQRKALILQLIMTILTKGKEK
jgi:hypothetical protein